MFPISKPVIIIPHQKRWAQEYQQISSNLRYVLGDTALRIDHIGSTSVKRMPAKDIIDIQVTIACLENSEDFIERMHKAGFRQREGIRFDSVNGLSNDHPELRKRYFRENEQDRRIHIHVRQQGFINQRYSLLFRDFLRRNRVLAQDYGVIKQKLAEVFPRQIDGYIHIKDPAMDMIFHMAEKWAEEVAWSSSDDYQ